MRICSEIRPRCRNCGRSRSRNSHNCRRAICQQVDSARTGSGAIFCGCNGGYFNPSNPELPANIHLNNFFTEISLPPAASMTRSSAWFVSQPRLSNGEFRDPGKEILSSNSLEESSHLQFSALQFGIIIPPRLIFSCSASLFWPREFIKSATVSSIFMPSATS